MQRLTNVDQRKRLANRSANESQRRAPRRAVRPGLYVIFKKTPRFRIIGKSLILHTAALIDISSEGLRARYTAPDKWSSPFDHIAITDADEANILSSMLAKRLGCKKVMALINRPSYAELVETGKHSVDWTPSTTHGSAPA